LKSFENQLGEIRMSAETSVKAATATTASKIHNGVDHAEESVDAAVDSFSARLAALEAQWREHGEALLESAREIGGVAEKQVRAHPLAAFGVAFAAGLVVAKLLRRR
jgi:ElaB/YqjD/DUF883 family membrane-anchored ribosome-binding protein